MTTKQELEIEFLLFTHQRDMSIEAIADQIINWADSLSCDDFCIVHAFAEKIAADGEVQR